VRRLYILDGVLVILEKEIVGEGEPVTKARYIPGVCMITKDNEANEVIRYYHEDALGSFIAMTDENQNLTALYQYDAWGNELLPQVSSLSPPPSENPYRWGGAHGYYADEDVGMYLMGLRWYDAFTGRFITRDPIGFAAGDMNQYRPMGNNPVNGVDPWGLEIYYANRGVKSAPRFSHSLIYIVPKDQDKWRNDKRFVKNSDGVVYAVISAFPSGIVGFESLTAHINHKEELSATWINSKLLPLPPRYLNENEAIEALLSSVENFQNQAPVAYPFLGFLWGEHNSNGFISGLLLSTGFALPSDTEAGTTGWSNPVPETYFMRPPPRPSPPRINDLRRARDAGITFPLR
jgi:RHS repeat-associated protein